MIASTQPLLFVKLGGSVITHREQYCQPNHERIHGYAAALRARWGQLRGRLVIVLGGGSFGHNTVERFGLNRPVAQRDLRDTHALTANMLTFKLEFSRQLRELGVPCYPFQTSAFVTAHDRELQPGFVTPVLEALRAGLLPILSGDSIFDTALGPIPFSSDRVHEIFLGRVALERIVVLSDVPGVLRRDDGSVIRRIERADAAWALEQAGPSGKRDVTGGMREKLAALLRAAGAGVGSLIADGRAPSSALDVLDDPEASGTYIPPFTERPL